MSWWRRSVDRLGDVVLAHDVEALLEDDLALIVHHVVVLEDVLADVEVARLDLLLRHLERLVHPRMGDGLAFLQAELLQHAVHAVGAEDAHQVVFEREVELGAAGVALAAGAAAQLVVDAPAFVPLGADHVEAAGVERRCFFSPTSACGSLAFLAICRARGPCRPRSRRRSILAGAHVGVAAELNVGAAAGHVGGDGHRARHAGLGDDVGFLLVVARVQHLVRDRRRCRCSCAPSSAR